MQTYSNLVELARICASQAHFTKDREVARELWRLVLEHQDKAASLDNGKLPDVGLPIKCSLVGVNPVYHPEIFGNPAAARSYGFVQSPDRVWRVESNCRRY